MHSVINLPLFKLSTSVPTLTALILAVNALVDNLEDNQIVLINPGYLSTAYFLKYCTKNLIIAEAESSFIDGRIMEPGYFQVGFRNVRNPIGIYPKQRMNEAIEKLDKLQLGGFILKINNVSVKDM